ncbi:hypothetical protein [Streptomyces sp. NPDC021356]|uniref:hypothetical protein n=1 Tax=Streptomyces sp. NPDC021356 TaxID=3154900 RepID=UPI0033BFD764
MTGLIGLPGWAAAVSLAAAPRTARRGASGAPFVVPELHEWAGTEGELRIRQDSRITVPRGGGRLLPLARKVTGEMAELTGVRIRPPRVGDGRPYDSEIHIRIDPADSHPADGERSVPAAGGAAFGVFTAAVFALVLAGVRGAAASSVSGLLPTAQHLGGSIGVAAAGLAYFAPAGGANVAFGHAMTYEAAVFLLTASITLRLRRTGSEPEQNRPRLPSATPR